MENTWDVVTWREFKGSIPEVYATPKAVSQARYYYHREVETIISYVRSLVEQGKPYYAYFGCIGDVDGSTQMIANFSVKDLSMQDDPQKVNWHLQNTSQWVYAGAMVIDKEAVVRDDERIVSTHH